MGTSDVIDLCSEEEDEDDDDGKGGNEGVVHITKKTPEVGGTLIDGDDCLEATAGAARPAGWTDPEFPPTPRSIEGAADGAKPPPDNEDHVKDPTALVCRCGVAPATSVVQSETPNKGRAYVRCARRACGFFRWADDDGRDSDDKTKQHEIRRPRRADATWRRVEGATGLGLTADLSAGDLSSPFRVSTTIPARGIVCQRYIVSLKQTSRLKSRRSQGAIGDCWFVSALGVVAERRDLIERLFVSTPRDDDAHTGAYACRLFIDGKWRVVEIDDLVPHLPSRRTKLMEPAFARCHDATTSRPTLWGSLIEKAYAKVHGSYSAISGGQISEALRDLTGANTASVEVSRHASFEELDRLWHCLVAWRRLDLPMGCATSSASDPDLRGNHAYSILAVKAYPEGRLLRVRDPHGESLFPAVDRLARDVATRLNEKNRSLRGAATEDDDDRALIRDAALNEESKKFSSGCFWIDYARFAAAFARVDVALAYRPGVLNARSLLCAFPPSRHAQTRSCDGFPLIFSVPPSAKTAATVSVCAIQPTRRGAADRAATKLTGGKNNSVVKKSYRCGDLGVVACDVITGRCVAWCLQGAEVGDVDFACVFRVEPRNPIALFCVCLGKNPSAASITSKQPFSLRVCADAPVLATRRHGGKFETLSPAVAVHAALDASVVGGKGGRDDSAPLLFPSRRRKLVRRIRLVGDNAPAQGGLVECLVSRGDGLVAVVAVNRGDTERAVEATAYCKSGVARASDDGELVEDDAVSAKKYYERTHREEQTGGCQYKWPAYWKCFRAAARVPPGRRRLVLVVARSGVQWRVGDVDCRLVGGDASSVSSSGAGEETTAKAKKIKGRVVVRGSKVQVSIADLWTTTANTTTTTKASAPRAVGLFAPVALPDTLSSSSERGDQRVAESSSSKRKREDIVVVVADDDDDDLRRAIELSRQDDVDDDLRRALELSRQECPAHFVADEDPPADLVQVPPATEEQSADARRRQQADALAKRGL